MAVTNNFTSSTLVLNGAVSLSQPTALVWGPDGRLYVTEVDGDVKVLTIAFGDPDLSDSDTTAQFYVTESITIGDIKNIPNYNDDGSPSSQNNRQVTGIDVTTQYDAAGDPVMIDGKPAVTMYVTSSDSRIGAGGSGNDAGLDTNSGIITKLTQTGPDSWDAVDIVRGFARSEENHALNGLEVIQEIDESTGKLVSERIIVANGGNANTGAPSNNFAGQQEQPLSGAILEIDLSMINGLPVQTDPRSGRDYVYDLPTLDDPTRAGANDDATDPFGGNDGLNSGLIVEGGPVQIYSPGYRNAYDVEVTDDGRVFTYDNGANNSWGGRPVGEAGATNSIDFAQAAGYIATNLNSGEGNNNDDINIVEWNPSNKDQLHEVTRSDDLNGGSLSQGAGGAQTYDVLQDDGSTLTYVYGGHPNPTRAEGSRAGLLFSPGAGTDNAFLLVSNEDSFGNGGGSDYDEVIAWLTEVEDNNADFPDNGIYGAGSGDLTKKVIAVTPGVAYDIYVQTDGSALIVAEGGTSPGGTFIGTAGLPSNIADIVVAPNAIEGNYLEAGKFDGALDSGNGSINGLTEYTSTILDQGDTKMSGAIIAASLNQGSLIVMGRNADGTMSSGQSGGFAVAEDRTTIDAGGGPLGLASLGDDVGALGLAPNAFTGSIWAATYNQNGPLIEVFQPNVPSIIQAGADAFDPEDNDLDGLNDIVDPFEFSPENGYALDAGQSLLLDFSPTNMNFPTALAGTGLLGAALDGSTPNQDAQTAFENFAIDQQQDGLYNIGENVLPGGNAPILQIKNVVDGTVVGTANTARDVLHTGIRPSADVERIVATMNVKNWLPEFGGDEQDGQLTGMIFGDGTQSNFVRVVFGSVNGSPGLEVGYEIDDVYTVLAQIAVPTLTSIDVDTVDLQLEIDMEDGFAVSVAYRLQGDAAFTDVALTNGATAGFSLPAGVLQDVLTGDYQITDGVTTLNSGASVGFLSEDTGGDDINAPSFNGLLAIDYNNLEIEAFGNEINATTGAEVGQAGTTGLDTVIYDGTDETLADLDAQVENFDGSGSAANFTLTANDNDNVIKVGSGQNTITTGGGSDSVQGTIAQLSGDTITDFSTDDEVIINGVSIADLSISYAAGSAVVVINGVDTITFDGPDFADFQAEDGADTFTFEDTPDGVRLVTRAALTPVIAINSGGPDVNGVTVRDQVVNFVSDLPDAPKVGFDTGSSYNDYTNPNAQSVDFPDTDLDAIHAYERSGNFTVWSYNIDVPDGEYLVDLYFAEIYHGLQNTSNPEGLRVFDVEIEGTKVLDNYDIISDAEASATEVLKTFQVTVTDGQLNLDFIKEVDQAKLSGLVVWSIDGTFVPPADETAPEITGIFFENPPSDQDSPRDLIVTIEDNSGFDVAGFVGLTGSELTFTDIEPAAIGAPSVEISADGLTATVTYELTAPLEGWPAGEGAVSIDAGSYADAAGNSTAAADSPFFVVINLDNLVAGEVALAINVGPTSNTIDASLAGDDKNTYGGAITGDAIINGINLQADDPAYYTPTTKTGSNIDGKAGATGSNLALDGSALHTYRDAASGSFTATYPIANGVYVVELWFAELFHSTGGNRQGDYTLNGEVMELNFDAFTAAGAADTAVSFTKNVIVTDGQIVIDVNADTGQPGFNAIVIYDAVPSDLPSTVSVADVSVEEGADATIEFSRIGDTTEEVTVTYTITPGTADTDDIDAPLTGSVTILANQNSASVTVPTVDDDEEESVESFTVTIDTVTNTSGDAVIAIGGGTATVTIAANDQPTDIPDGGALFDLDFEGATGEAIAVGGFDGVLGAAGNLDEAASEVTGGKLVVQTSEGDINDANGTDNIGSGNDFTKMVDVSDPALTQLFLTSRFDNPFTQEVLTSNGVTTETIPNYVQQGIVLGTGTQNAGEMVKLVWGGVAAGFTAGDSAGSQLWSKGGVADQKVAIAQMIEAGKTLFDVASVQMSLEIDRDAGTVGQWITLYGAGGEEIGGVRPTETVGFFTIAPVEIPPLVLANLNDPAAPTHFGVTSSDNSQPEAGFGSFEVSWENLALTSPQFTPVEGPDTVNGTLYNDFSDDGLAPTDIGDFANGSNVITARQVGDAGPRDRDYFTFEVPEGQVLNAINLTGYINEDPGDTNGFMAIQRGTQVTFDPTDPSAENQAAFGELLGGLIYGSGELNNDILATMAEGGDVQGAPFPGFDLPLEAGSYTIWMNQGAALPTTVTLDFVLADRPADVQISIADAADAIENGDFNSTALEFAVTDAGDFTGTLTITYDTGTQAGLTQDVTMTDGAGILIMLVDNDALDNGPDAVAITLTAAIDAAGTLDVAIVDGAANGVVTEDDAALPLERGAVVYAVNAGGPALTQDGIDFEGNASGTDGNPFSNGDTFTDNGAGNGLQPELAGTVYQTEVNDGGNDGSVGVFDAAITFDGIDPDKSYFIDLYFAEIYASTVGTRVFDVVIEGVAPAPGSLLDNIDILAQNGGSVETPLINNPLIIEVPDAVTPGANGKIDLSFLAEADRSKISAIVVREAVQPTGATDVIISVADVTADEEGGIANVVFTRDGDTSSDVVVTFTVDDGTGTAGTDYLTPATSITILAGEATATLPVTLIDNPDEAPAPKTFNVTITDVTPAGGESARLGSGSATVTINDDEAFDPEDIDLDGVLNDDDPLAYDGDNGLGNVVTIGGRFRQDFNVDSTNPFSEDVGFTGIIVNTVPGYTPPGTSATDPYGDRTTETTFDVDGNLTGGAEVKDGSLRVFATETDSYADGTPANQSNQIKDNYLRGADVSGVELFSVEAKAANPWPTITSGQNGFQYASLGITLGAGGTDDWVKLVYGVRNNSVAIEFASQNSLTTGNQVVNVTYPVEATEAAADLLFRFDVTKSSDTVGMEGMPTMTGIVTLLDGDGNVLQTITTGEKVITGSLLDAIDGNNPLTGGTGGIAYGVAVTKWGAGAGNGFIGEWDYIEVSAPDTAPTVDAGIAPQTATENTPLDFTLPLDVFADDGGVPNLTLSAVALNGEGLEMPLPAWLTFDPATANFSGTPADGDGELTIRVTADDGTNPPVSTSFVLNVTDIPGPFIWFADADGDGVGTSADQVTDYTAPGEPGDYVLSDLGDDDDDTDGTIFPGAPEVNDGKDNDQDGDIDEDNLAPVTGDDSVGPMPNGVVTFTRAGLLSNDSDPDGDDLGFALVPESATGGAVTFSSATGVITFTPDPEFTGAASFQYEASDDFGGTTVQTVTINIDPNPGMAATPVPLLNADVSSYGAQDKRADNMIVDELNQVVEMQGNTWKQIALGAAPLTVTEGMQLRFTVNSINIPELMAIGFDSDDSWNNAGTALFQIGGSQTVNAWEQAFNTYDAAALGTDVTITIPLDEFIGQQFENLVFVNDEDIAPQDGAANYFNIEILTPAAFNGAPLAVEDDLIMEADQPLVITTATLLANDSDPDGDALSLVSVGNAKNGSVTLSNGLVTFEATEGYSGAASFDYTITDTAGQTSIATANINVLPEGGGDVVTAINFNDAPIQSYETQDAKPGTGFSIADEGASITLDGNVWKKTAIPGSYTVNEDTVLRFDLSVLNPSGEIVAIGLENDNSFRTDNDVIFQLSGSQNFRPWSNTDLRGSYTGAGSPQFYEIDLSAFAGQSFSQLVLINDDDVNNTSVVSFANVELVQVIDTSGDISEAPQIFGGSLADQTVSEDAPFEIDLPFFDTDTPFEDLVFSFTNMPDFMSEDAGVLVGTASNADVGSYEIAVTATDPEGNSTTDTFTLVVENVNDAPELAGTYDDVELIVNSEVLLPLPTGLFTDIDVGTVLIYSASGLPDGVVIDQATGALSGTPTEFGDFNVTITANDGPIGAPDTLSASITFLMDVLSGPPRETLLIEAEDFTAFTDPDDDVEGFFKSFAAPASGNQVIRVDVNGSGSISTKLDDAGLVPGFYDISVIHFDETDGISFFTVSLDYGDGSAPVVVGSYRMDRDDLPGQGIGTQAGNINEAVFPTVNIPAGAKLIIEGVAEIRDTLGGREVLRIDAVRFDPIDNTPPVIDTPAEATVSEGATLALDVDATDLEGVDLTYAITGGEDAALFTIDATTGEVSFLTAPDFEAPLDLDGNNVYDVIVSVSDGDVSAEQTLAITVGNVEELPIFSSETVLSVAENDTAAASVAAIDPDGTTVSYALAGTGADEALFSVDPVSGVVTFIAAPDFEAPLDADLNGTYEVSVTADDGTSTATTDLQITVTDANDAPVAVTDPEAQPVIIDAPLALDITALFSDQDAGDTLSYAIVSGVPAGITGIVEGVLTGTPTEIGAFDVVISATDGIAPPVEITLTLNVDAADNTFGRVAPSQDLDTDGTINSADDDVDGDGLLNVADSFAYDADNGTLIADGESIELTFDVNGTPYQNGFTGLLQAGLVGSSALKDFDEDTGNTSVAGGLLTTTTTTGDTGGADTPEDDYQLGVKNADFTVEARVLNPFQDGPAISYSQIGLHVGIDSTDFVKFVFGNAVEFSTRTDNVEAKVSGGNQTYPDGVALGDFASVDITLTVNSVSATAATVSAIATFLDAAGNALPGGAGINFGSAAISGALAAALADETVGVGTGFTQVHAGGTAFDAQLDSFKVTATDGGSIDPANALAVFEGETLFTGAAYAPGAVGAAVLEVMTGNNNVQSSNYGANSFQLTNTGDKKISAVFIDVTGALYQDSVFDPDGAGGDNATKPWGVDNDGNTGAEIVGGVGGYFLPGLDPAPNTTGTGIASNGGYKGALVTFNGSDLGFQNGETVGFSGDMDPNSIAGLDKNGGAGVDTAATNGWDVGGISGHEIIGSTFTILFDDGSTASGQLASDGSTAGSQGLAAQNDASVDAPSLVVNGNAPGEVGTYGVDQPTILVTGDPGSTVRITMTKGFDPVENATGGIDTLVTTRLERYDFKASNSFDNQTVDVVIGEDGTFDATGLFDYDDTLSNGGVFPGSDTADIGFVASVIDTANSNLSISPVTRPIYLTNEGGPVVGDPLGNDGATALEVFNGETDLVTNAVYVSGETGSAVLDIMAGVENIEGSNYGSNSFKVTNTGEKKISAVFIDVSDALYQDSVFDPDGAGGDNVAKAWAVNSAGGTGAYISGGTGGYFIAGVNPLPNTTGTGQASNGGYKGAIVKFTDFNNGETVGFSGDMDPNSIAGLTKDSVDGSAIDSWDVGGVSGHELIGSRFTVLFDDGTTASGQLASDGSASGSQALADQNLTAATTPTLTVNGVAAGNTGTYGGTQPVIIVSGDEGDIVRITMTKGFNPVIEPANGIGALVEARLDRYDFKANNNFDSQSVDVVIGPDGTFDATGLFDYDDAVANNKADGTFPGDDVAQIGFVASVIDPSNNDLAISAVTTPIYLTNDGGPVTGDPVLPIDGYFEIIGSGSSNARFKIQVEDANGSGGVTPGADWTYATAPDASGNQSGFQGDGYYIWKDGATEGVNPAQGIIEYEIFIPEGDEGVYSFRARGSRDPGTPSDQANDIWFRIDGDAEALQVNSTNSVSNAGFVKVFGTGTGGWGNTAQIDSVLEEDANFAAQFNLTAGFHTLAIAGRSGGYAIDYFDFYKGGTPSLGASNSSFSMEDPGTVTPSTTYAINASSDDWEQYGGGTSGDIELGLNGVLQSVGLRFTGIDIPEDSIITEAYFQFEANGSTSGPASFTIEIENTESAATYSSANDQDDRTYLADDFDWNDVEDWTDGQSYTTPQSATDLADMIEAVIGTDGIFDGELAFRITGTGGRAAHSFDSDGDAPELFIVFEPDVA